MVKRYDLEKDIIINAIRRNDYEELSTLLTPDNIHNKINNWSYLDYAVYNRKIEIIKMLISMGIDINELDDFKENSLFKALDSLSITSVKILLDENVNKTQQNIYGLTVLDIAKIRQRNSTENEKNKISKIIELLSKTK